MLGHTVIRSIGQEKKSTLQGDVQVLDRISEINETNSGAAWKGETSERDGLERVWAFPSA